MATCEHGISGYCGACCLLDEPVKAAGDVSCEYANSLLAQLEKAESEVRRLQSGIDTVNDDNQRLLRKIEAYQERVQHLEQDSATTHAAPVAQVTRLTRERDEARATNLTWLAKYNAQRGELAGVRDEVTRLTEALAAAERKRAEHWRNHRAASKRAEAAEARVRELEALEFECAALRAEVERFKAGPTPDWVEVLDREVGGRMAAEASLAAANALLEDTAALSYCPTWLKTAIRARLAAQPATAPAQTEEQEWVGDAEAYLASCGYDPAPARPHCDDHAGWRSDCDRCAMYEPPAEPSRTEAEQAVLDAMAKAEIGEFGGRPCMKSRSRANSDAAAAELARRGLK